jgi:hypothetical protein
MSKPSSEHTGREIRLNFPSISYVPDTLGGLCMMSLWNLLWIVPMSASIGALLMALVCGSHSYLDDNPSDYQLKE